MPVPQPAGSWQYAEYVVLSVDVVQRLHSSLLAAAGPAPRPHTYGLGRATGARSKPESAAPGHLEPEGGQLRVLQAVTYPDKRLLGTDAAVDIEPEGQQPKSFPYQRKALLLPGFGGQAPQSHFKTGTCLHQLQQARLGCHLAALVSGETSSDPTAHVGSKRRARGPVMAAKKGGGSALAEKPTSRLALTPARRKDDPSAGTARRIRRYVERRRRGAHGGEKEQQGGKYKETVNLPQTEFSMRANSAVKEPQIQKLWEDKQVMRKLQQSNPGVLQGRKVQYVPGWDCHGLPIELKVLQSMDAEARKVLTPIKLRKKAAQFALKTVDQQRASFKRYGVWGEWDKPYMTLQPEYEAAQMSVFGEMVLNGHIYRGKKPVHWSPSSGTALAEAELEYPEGHTSRSIYVAFKLTKLADAFPQDLKALLPSLGLAIWTTTPWTIPANAAVAVNDRLTYAVVEVQAPASPPEDAAAPPAPTPEAKFGKGPRNGGRGLDEPGTSHIIVAADLVPALEAKWGRPLAVKGTFPGSALELCMYKHPLEERESPVVIGGDYITTESGTGLVHTAPGHGQEDYLTGQKYDLPMLSPVDDQGNFTDEAGPLFAGQSVLGEGNTAVVRALNESSSLLLEEAYVHKYPYDWRTKKPTIFRATEQWFASVEGFRQQALDAIAQVQWFPPQGEKRITSMTVGRSDWCISRQRTWGVPIPVFYHLETGEPLMNADTIAHAQSIVAAKGSDAWFQLSVEELLPEAYRGDAHLYRKGLDTMDPAENTVAYEELPAMDRYVLARLAAVMDEIKESYESYQFYRFFQLVQRYVVVELSNFYFDVCKDRLYVGGLDSYTRRACQTVLGAHLLCLVRAIAPVLPHMAEDAWQSLPFAGLSPQGQAAETVFEALWPEVDARWRSFPEEEARLWSNLLLVRAEANKVLEVARTGKLIGANLDAKVYLHTSDAGLAEQLRGMAGCGEGVDRLRSVLLTSQVRAEANKVLEVARTGKLIGANLDAKVYLHTSDAGLAEQLRGMAGCGEGVDRLRSVLLTSQVELVSSLEEAQALGLEYTGTATLEEVGELWVGVAFADGDKCERCWNYSKGVGSVVEHSTLCERCSSVVLHQAPKTPVAA
eukprot:jgi/Mesen1/9506/ME000637S08955